MTNRSFSISTYYQRIFSRLHYKLIFKWQRITSPKAWALNDKENTMSTHTSFTHIYHIHAKNCSDVPYPLLYPTKTCNICYHLWELCFHTDATDIMGHIAKPFDKRFSSILPLSNHFVEVILNIPQKYDLLYHFCFFSTEAWYSESCLSRNGVLPTFSNKYSNLIIERFWTGSGKMCLINQKDHCSLFKNIKMFDRIVPLFKK